MAELVIAEAERGGGAALVEAMGGERLGQELLLIGGDAVLEATAIAARRQWRCGVGRRRHRPMRRGEGIEHDLLDGIVGPRPAIEAALDHVLELAHIAGPGMRREP